MEKLHIPVLLSEVLAGLQPQLNDKYLDLTAGYGGHAEKILDVTKYIAAVSLMMSAIPRDASSKMYTPSRHCCEKQKR